MFIRKTEKKDFLAIQSWIKTSEECRLWAGPKISFPLEMETFFHEIDLKNQMTFSFFEDDIIGFAQLLNSPTPDTLHLARIIIAPHKRGRGTGYSLLCRLLQEAGKKAGIATLNVYKKNTKALNLYTSLGFKIVDDKSSLEIYSMEKIL